MKKALTFNLFFLLIISQTIVGKISAQLFRNNNVSCEEVPVAGVQGPGQNNATSSSIACGQFQENMNQVGDVFSDCATQIDPIRVENPDAILPVSNTVFFNTEAKQDNCFNAGDSNPQFTNFLDYANQGFALENPDIIRMGSIQVGNLNEGDFDDLAFMAVEGLINPDSIEPQLQSLLSQPGGGFGDLNFIPQVAIPLDELSFFPSNFFTSNLPDLIPDNIPTQENLVLLNCDGDNVEEALVATRQTINEFFDSPGVLFFPNDGFGLLDANDLILLGEDVSGTSEVGLSITTGDYDQDGDHDFMAALNTDEAFPIDGNDRIIFCQGTGGCGFSCLTLSLAFDLESICDGPCDPYPTSIVTGDFDGDDDEDLAVATFGLPQIVYLLNDGIDPVQLQNWGVEVVDLPIEGDVFPRPLVLAKGRFSTVAFNQGIDEVVATAPQFVPNPPDNPIDFSQAQNPAKVVVFSTLGNPEFGVEAQNLSFFPENVRSPQGLDVKNFDQCGQDDIVALAETFDENANTVDRFASLFLSTNLPPDVIAAPNFNGEVGVNIPVPANCTDPTMEDRTFNWSVQSAPANANVIFSVPNGQLVGQDDIASTEFNGDTEGNYTIRLTCVDECGEASFIDVFIQLSGSTDDGTATVDDGTVTTSGTGDTTVVDATATSDTTSSGDGPTDMIPQGGCIARLNPSSSPLIQWLVVLLPLLALKVFRVQRAKFSFKCKP